MGVQLLAVQVCPGGQKERREQVASYPPNSLRQVSCGILRYMRETDPELDIFKQSWLSEDIGLRNEEVTKLSHYKPCQFPTIQYKITISVSNAHHKIKKV